MRADRLTRVTSSSLVWRDSIICIEVFILFYLTIVVIQ
jgi:hypothetical protein